MTLRLKGYRGLIATLLTIVGTSQVLVMTADKPSPPAPVGVIAESAPAQALSLPPLQVSTTVVKHESVPDFPKDPLAVPTVFSGDTSCFTGEGFVTVPTNCSAVTNCGGGVIQSTSCTYAGTTPTNCPGAQVIPTNCPGGGAGSATACAGGVSSATNCQANVTTPTNCEDGSTTSTSCPGNETAATNCTSGTTPTQCPGTNAATSCGGGVVEATHCDGFIVSTHCSDGQWPTNCPSSGQVAPTVCPPNPNPANCGPRLVKVSINQFGTSSTNN